MKYDVEIYFSGGHYITASDVSQSDLMTWRSRLRVGQFFEIQKNDHTILINPSLVNYMSYLPIEKRLPF